MIALGLVAALLLAGLLATVYLLGFRLGGTSTLEALNRVRLEAELARRQMEMLTRQAFVALLDEARRHQQR